MHYELFPLFLPFVDAFLFSPVLLALVVEGNLLSSSILIKLLLVLVFLVFLRLSTGNFPNIKSSFFNSLTCFAYLFSFIFGSFEISSRFYLQRSLPFFLRYCIACVDIYHMISLFSFFDSSNILNLVQNILQ